MNQAATHAFIVKLQVWASQLFNASNIEYTIAVIYSAAAVIMMILVACDAYGVLISNLMSSFNWLRGKIPSSRIDKHLKSLLDANGVSDKITPFRFKCISLGVGVLSLLLCVRVLAPGMAIIYSVCMSLIPYCIFKVRLEKVRSASSYEAEVIVNEFIVRYRISNGSIENAIDSLIKSGKLGKSKRLFLPLLLKIRSTTDASKLREAVDKFAYSIGTNWAEMFVSNIYQALVTHISIEESLMDMSRQVKEARIINEKKKRNMAEPRQLLWFIPLGYAMSAYVAIGQLGTPIHNLIYNQFYTQRGVSCFMFIVLGFFISLLAVNMFTNKRFDF